MLGLQESREGLSPSGDGDWVSLSVFSAPPRSQWPFWKRFFPPAGRIVDREASVGSPVAPCKCSASSAAGDFPDSGGSWSALAGGWSGTGRQPRLVPGGTARHLCAPRRAGSAAFVPPALGSPQPQRPRRAPRQLGTRQRSGLAARRRRRPRSCSRPRRRRDPGPGPARPHPSCREASVPRGTPSSAKEPLPTRILFRIKTFIYFFCFVSQSVSSKECRTLQTNLAFFAFTDCFLQFRRMLQT